MSEAALAAAKRFSSAQTQRKYEDLQIVIKELCKASDTHTAAKADCQPLSRLQLTDLLGASDPGVDVVLVGERYELRYVHNYGSTYFSFEDDKLKGYLFYGEPIYWYALPPQPFVKRAWYKVRRWSRKLIRVVF